MRCQRSSALTVAVLAPVRQQNSTLRPKAPARPAAPRSPKMANIRARVLSVSHVVVSFETTSRSDGVGTRLVQPTYRRSANTSKIIAPRVPGNRPRRGHFAQGVASVLIRDGFVSLRPVGRGTDQERDLRFRRTPTITPTSPDLRRRKPTAVRGLSGP